MGSTWPERGMRGGAGRNRGLEWDQLGGGNVTGAQRMQLTEGWGLGGSTAPASTHKIYHTRSPPPPFPGRGARLALASSQVSSDSRYAFLWELFGGVGPPPPPPGASPHVISRLALRLAVSAAEPARVRRSPNSTWEGERGRGSSVGG